MISPVYFRSKNNIILRSEVIWKTMQAVGWKWRLILQFITLWSVWWTMAIICTLFFYHTLSIPIVNGILGGSSAHIFFYHLAYSPTTWKFRNAEK